jgi:ATP/maltotriose-dependent transcriptional regulator MalT
VILPALVRRNVFISFAGNECGEEYRLHSLFLCFLRRRLLEEIGCEGMTAGQAHIAYYFLKRGEWAQAVQHLLEAEEFDRAAMVIAEKEQTWINSGALKSLMRSVDAIPSEVVERHPRALTFCAEVSRLCGEYDAAQVILHRATVLLHEQGDCEGEAEALHSLAEIAWLCEEVHYLVMRAYAAEGNRFAVKKQYQSFLTKNSAQGAGSRTGRGNQGIIFSIVWLMTSILGPRYYSRSRSGVPHTKAESLG